MTDQNSSRAIHLIPGLNVFADRDELSHAAAEFVLRTATAAVLTRGICTIALTGGSSPCRLYRLLADRPYRHGMPWSHTHLFWGDERCVPPDHPDSNYFLARTLLEGIAIPDSNVHRMRGEEEPGRAAWSYHELLRDFFEPSPGRFPRFDMILLGLGEDGHVASLFPNGLELGESTQYAIETQKPGGWKRISLTLPTINAARNVVFLVPGANKAEALRRALGDPDRHVPGSLVRPTEGTLYWLADADAAAAVKPA